MTLELLVNKRQYRKYLEKTNTTEYAQKREHYSRFCKYKCAIARLLDDLLNDYSISGNSAHLGNAELQDIFEAFVQKSTYFFAAKEQEILVSPNQISDDYESNTMFDRIFTCEDESSPVNPRTTTRLLTSSLRGSCAIYEFSRVLVMIESIGCNACAFSREVSS